MADNKEKDNNSEYSANTYIWQTSILNPSHLHGMYVKFLEKVAPDARVPFVRLLISLMAIAIVIVFGGKFLYDAPMRIPYVLWQTILLVVCICGLLIIYMISSHEGSMLLATSIMTINYFVEQWRCRHNLKLNSLGIDSINKTTAEIKFTNGDVGRVYAVKGILSISTLPSVADFINDSRSRYEISRTEGSQELRITTISPNELEPQLDDLTKFEKEGISERDGIGSWKKNMAKYQKSYMRNLIDNGNQLTMIQTVIIRDVDREQLRKSCINFENGANQGMYERYRLIEDYHEIIERLGECAMMSNIKAVDG